MTESELLDRFYEHYDAQDYLIAEKIIRRIIKNGDTSAWAYTKLSSMLYEQRKYGWALFYSKKAFELDNRNPIIIWHLANAYSGSKNEIMAINSWKLLIENDPKEIGLKRTNMGLSWAKKIINDSKFRVGESFFKLYQDEEAKKYLNEYLYGRKHSRNSLYSRNDALKLLKEINNKN